VDGKFFINPEKKNGSGRGEEKKLSLSPKFHTGPSSVPRESEKKEVAMRTPREGGDKNRLMPPRVRPVSGKRAEGDLLGRVWAPKKRKEGIFLKDFFVKKNRRGMS